MDPEKLFRDNLSLLDRIVARVCRQARLVGADAEDFASAARLHLMENDYAVLRRFEGRCSLATYLTIVVQRFLAVERIRAWGRWHDSSAAKKLGEVAVRAEQLIRRDGRSLEEALPILRDLDPALTRAGLEAIVERLPDRKSRLRAVDAGQVELTATHGSAEERVDERDARRTSDRVGDAMRAAMASLPLEERTMIRLRFRASMTLADIARAMGVPQRPLYRRMERVLAELREALMRAGIDRRSVEELIGSKVVEIDFGLENEGDFASTEEGAQRT